MATGHDKQGPLFRNRYRIPSARRPGWDYSRNGAYFVTICTNHRDPCLGEVDQDRVLLSPHGEIVAREWRRIPGRHPSIILDEWIVMPDHMHGILWINGGSSSEDSESRSALGIIIGRFKSKSTKSIRASGYLAFDWQTRFHDRILRSPEELERARIYIRQNPIRWAARKKAGRQP